MDGFHRLNHTRYITKVEGGSIVRSKYKHVGGALVKHYTKLGRGTTSKIDMPLKSHTDIGKEILLNNIQRAFKRSQTLK